jgi:hypothetical protein
MIGQKFNFDEVFFRDLTVCVLDTLEGRLNWINRFSSGNVPVNVPIYYSMTGDDRFLLDSFQDDIVSENRYVELNTDQIPRGHLTLTNFNIRSDEFRNPNVWLRTVIEDDVEVKKLLKKVRAIPITVTYDLTIILKNEIDIFKCAQEIMNTLWLYRFMYFEHNYLHIDAVMLMPDSETIQIQREKNLKSDDTVRLTATIEVQTYYPAFVNSNQEKFRATVSEAQPGIVVQLNSVVGISIGQQVVGSGVTLNVTVLSINYQLNLVILSVIDIDLISGQVLSFVNVDNNGLPISEGVDNNFSFNNTASNEYIVTEVLSPPVQLDDVTGITVGATVSSSNSSTFIPPGTSVVVVDVINNYIYVTTNTIISQPQTAEFVGSINGTNMIVSSVSFGQIEVGMQVTGSGILPGTIITDLGTGTGGQGIYVVNIDQNSPNQSLEAIKLSEVVYPKSNPTYNFIYNQPINIGGNTYNVVNGTNIINLITVKDVQVGQQVTGPNLPNSVKVLEVIDQSNQVVVSRPVSVSSGQPLFFAFDSNISDASVPFKTRWFSNLYVNKFQNRVSSNPNAEKNSKLN